MSTTWAYAWEGFLIDMEARHRSPNTIANRKSNVTIMARHATHDGLTPEQITRPWLQHYLQLQRQDRQGNGYVSVYQDLRAFWMWWVDDSADADGSGPPNPMAKIPRPSTVDTTVPVLTEANIDAILGTCAGRDFEPIRNRAIILLLLASGLRRFELTALDVDDVDIKQRTITVRHGKGDRARVTVFGPVTAQAILRYLRARDLRAHSTQDALFVSRNGTRLTRGGLGQLITRIGKLAGVDGLHPHTFRHTWADGNLSDGIQEHDLCQLAGAGPARRR